MAYKKEAIDAAASYMSSRMRTEAEVRRHLKDKEYSAEEIDDAVEKLKELHYIDDYEYALRYFEYAYARDRAHSRIIMELTEKGVSGETCQNAYEDYCYENDVDEYKMALSHARKLLENELESGRRQFDDKLEAKIARNLASRGFPAGDVYRVLAELKNE